MPYQRADKWVGCVKRTVDLTQHKREKIFRGAAAKKQAIAWEVEQRGRTDAEFVRGTRTGTVLSLLDLANDYTDYAVRFCSKTRDEKKSTWLRLFKMYEHGIPVKHLTPKMALDYLNAQMAVRSGNAANKDRKNLVAAWNWGRKFIEGFPVVNPWAVCERMPEQRSPRYVPSEADFWKVVDISVGQDRLVLLAYLFTAARKSELFRLLVSEVDFGAGAIELRSRKNRSSSWEIRRVPMVDELYDLMLAHVQALAGNDYVFTCSWPENMKGEPYKNRYHWLKKQCDRAGVKRFDWHSIRHLTSRILAQRGVPSKVIQEILGHKNLRTTEIYLGSLGVDKKHLRVLVNNKKVRQMGRLTDKVKLEAIN